MTTSTNEQFGPSIGTISGVAHHLQVKDQIMCGWSVNGENPNFHPAAVSSVFTGSNATAGSPADLAEYGGGIINAQAIADPGTPLGQTGGPWFVQPQKYVGQGRTDGPSAKTDPRTFDHGEWNYSANCITVPP